MANELMTFFHKTIPVNSAISAGMHESRIQQHCRIYVPHSIDNFTIISDCPGMHAVAGQKVTDLNPEPARILPLYCPETVTEKTAMKQHAIDLMISRNTPVHRIIARLKTLRMLHVGHAKIVLVEPRGQAGS